MSDTLNMDNIEVDGVCYVVQSGYLKFPSGFRKRYGIAAGMILDNENATFPNPRVGMLEDKKKIQLVFEFEKKELEEWQKKRHKE